MSHSHRDRSYPPLPEPLPVAVYDNHTHIDPASDESPRVKEGDQPLSPTEHLDRAVAVGVAGIVQVGTDPESSRWSAQAAADDARVLAAVAIHPNYIYEYSQTGILADGLVEIARLAHQPRVRAVGETGLDYHYMTPGTDEAAAERAVQIEAFEAHIEIAKQVDVAMQIHDRDAHDDIVATLLRVGAPERTVFHCFSGDVDLARVCAEHGWYMSFAGNVTFGNAHNLRRALAVAPADRILVETDAPYLTPMPYRGRPNAPYLIPQTLRAMAEVRGSELEAFATQVAANTRDVYGEW